jgi:hypothetical protein
MSRDTTAASIEGSADTVAAPGVTRDHPELFGSEGTHYDLAEEIAHGGMGVVRLARDRGSVAKWRSRLHADLGDALVATGDPRNARASYVTALELATQAAKSRPDDHRWRERIERLRAALAHF